ncbi:hypothetical protein ACQKJG_18440 [Priestia megaterium]|uniref:hypothetical protein n=1 Tax=Priestia megaterium TaxID=1404 RepID=UPI003D061584
MADKKLTKQDLINFRNELDQLYKKYGVYLETDGGNQDIFLGDPETHSEMIYVVFNREEKRYTLWETIIGEYHQREYKEIKEDEDK